MLAKQQQNECCLSGNDNERNVGRELLCGTFAWLLA